jgi:2-iminobutanoate/2-iminopropanoate deaminase
MAESPHTPIEPTGIYAPATYAHAMRAGDTLYVAGQVARGVDGALVAPGDAAAQAEVVFANLGAVLAAAGAKPEYVVKVTTYLVDAEDGAAVGRARQAFFGEHRPPHTGLIVRLGAGVKVEVEVVAVFP